MAKKELVCQNNALIELLLIENISKNRYGIVLVNFYFKLIAAYIE